MKKSEKFSIDKKIENSKFDFCKNLKFAFLIPALIIIVGIVLGFTIGFNFDSTIKGYTSVNVCANSYGTIESATNKYNLYGNKQEGDLDFADLKNDVQEILNKFNVKAFSFNKTYMNISDSILDEPAVEVCFDKTLAPRSYDELRVALQEKFGYTDEWQNAISQINDVQPLQDTSLFMNLMIATLVALVLAFAYMAFRYDFSSAFAGILGVFHDLLLLIAFVLLCRIPVGANFVAVLFAATLYSLYSHIVVFSRVNENVKSGVYQRGSGESITQLNGRIANISIKETLVRSMITTAIMLGLLVLLIAFAPNAIQLFVLPLLFAVCATFFSSTFITPGLWSISFRPKKKKIAK